MFLVRDLTEIVLVVNETFGTTMDLDRLAEGLLPWLLGLASALDLFI